LVPATLAFGPIEVKGMKNPVWVKNELKMRLRQFQNFNDWEDKINHNRSLDDQWYWYCDAYELSRKHCTLPGVNMEKIKRIQETREAFAKLSFCPRP
jgi:hypothetical protein